MGYTSPRQIFNAEEEFQLETYIKKACDIYFGLTLTEVRKLANDCGKALLKSLP
ncbi:hypothetical protein RN001_013642 [Aquatica leii]|uniref:Uncharacterized protein n=1 Tax=Aquatica leii TaxID=1421715 RepID=A0AAN7PS06_9COLE|nr:hypothetical protein RN001_013642 [Aquatica leii]